MILKVKITKQINVIINPVLSNITTLIIIKAWAWYVASQVDEELFKIGDYRGNLDFLEETAGKITPEMNEQLGKEFNSNDVIEALQKNDPNNTLELCLVIEIF